MTLKRGAGTMGTPGADFSTTWAAHERAAYRVASGARLTGMRYIALAAVCTALMAAESFAPADVTVLGDIDYGATSDALDCPGTQKYCAVVFNGMSGDNVEVAATGGEGQPFVAIADGSLGELARGTGAVKAKLPQVKDDLATYYIVFRDSQGKPGKFKLTLKKVE